MKTLLTGGMYSLLIFAWTIIAIAVFVVCYKRLAKHLLIVVGSALGSILFSIGTLGFFSGLTHVMRAIGETATPSIQATLMEGIRYARIPFSLATVLTIIYFIIISILIILRKQPFKKWAIWIGFLVFFLFSFLPAFYRQTMNTQFLRGVSKVMGFGDRIPLQIVPLVRAGRMAVITSFAMLMVYLLIAILLTIHKRAKKPVAVEAEIPPGKEEQPPEATGESPKEGNTPFFD
jgi:hypothetical protein